jgi:putative oxidoreductase
VFQTGCAELARCRLDEVFMPITIRLPSALARAQALTRRAAFVPALLARLTVGLAFVESGWGKLHHLDRVAEYFHELGLPAPAFQAAFVSGVELICGSLVLLGLGTRIASLPLIATMVVALLTAKASEIAGLSDLLGTIELCYALLLVWLAIAGPGAVSLDHRIAQGMARRVRAEAPSALPASVA